MTTSDNFWQGAKAAVPELGPDYRFGTLQEKPASEYAQAITFRYQQPLELTEEQYRALHWVPSVRQS